MYIRGREYFAFVHPSGHRHLERLSDSRTNLGGFPASLLEMNVSGRTRSRRLRRRGGSFARSGRSLCHHER